MGKRDVKVTVGQISDALWGIEDWVRSVREVLSVLPQEQEIELPQERPDMMPNNGSGTPTRLIKGCPPPCPPPCPPEEDPECEKGEREKGEHKKKKPQAY